MTNVENFRATVAHRRPGRILARAGFTPDLYQRVREHIGGADPHDHYGMARLQTLSIPRRQDAEKIDYTAYWRNVPLPEGAWINDVGVVNVPSGMYHLTGYRSPLADATDLAELERFPLEGPEDWEASGLAEQVRRRHADGEVAGGWVGHMYETAWQIRGYEPFLMDLVERPVWAECLLERLAERNLFRAVAYARAGADVICCGDDVANQKSMMFSPDLWRELMLSRWARVWTAAREVNPQVRVWYHSDGNIAPIIGDLLEAGVDILNPLQPECMDLQELHRSYGDRVTFDGCIGTQSTMPFGTPQDVRRRVRELIDAFGRDGGLILSPTHVLEPEVPLANIDAFFDACREFGTFD